MSLSRAVYSDGCASRSLYSNANPMQEPPKARRLKKKEEENAGAVHLGFHMDNRNKTAMDGVEGNMEFLLLWKTEAEREVS